MITCPNCNKKLEDGTKFCDTCGNQVVETVFCQNCGEQVSTEFAFCKNCGAPLANEAVAFESPEKEQNASPKLPFKLPKKLISIGGACVALVLVVSILFSILFRGGSDDIALYFKDDEMYFTGTSKIKPWQVTSHLSNNDYSSSEAQNLAEASGLYTTLSDDGKILFYPDRIDSDSCSLFYRYVNNPKKEPIKIDSDVKLSRLTSFCPYSISQSGKLVTYLKGDGNTLYQYNFKDKEKIASDVSVFEVSGDGKKIVYLNKEESLYLKQSGKDKEKIDSNVSGISYISEDFNTVYYVKENSLYKKVDGKDKEKIASDISAVIQVYESGEVYYTKSNSSEITLADYVEDDMKDTDDAMTQPEYPEYPSYSNYENIDSYQVAVEQYKKEYEAYEIARDAWYDKQERDELREDLAGKTMTNSSYTLCYYNGKEEKVLTETYDTYSMVSGNSPVIVFSAYNQSTVTKVKLSEVEYISEVETMVEEALYSSFEKYIVIKDSSSVIEQDHASYFNITSDGKTVYFLADVSDENYQGDIYKINISGNTPQKPELYDSDAYGIGLASNDKIVYYKNFENFSGDLYVDKQLIDSDVHNGLVSYIEKSDTYVYMTDFDRSKQNGTLKIFKGKKAEKISDDVHIYDMTYSGDILYLSDYSSTYYKGDLFVYRNGKSEKIDSEVSALVPNFNGKDETGSYFRFIW